MITNKKLFDNKILQENLPKIRIKSKRDFKIPLSIPSPITYDNIYSSLSEKQRHLSMIEKFYILRQLITNDSEHEFLILKEFMSKLGITDTIYYQSKCLIQLSKFIHGDIIIDPNNSLKENTINIFKDPFNDNKYISSPHSKQISLMNKEQHYISPLILNKKTRGNNNRFHINKKHICKIIKQNSNKLPSINHINNSPLIKRYSNDNNNVSSVEKFKSQNQSIEILEKEFLDGIESYANQSIDNNRRNWLNILYRDNTMYKENILKLKNRINLNNGNIGINNSIFWN